MNDVTAAKRQWTPNWAIHPGALLEEHLEARGLSQADFARVAGLTPKLVSTIVKGSNPVTAETAIRLERVLGLKAYIWTGIQARWDLFQARARAKSSAETRSWLSLFPIGELLARKCIPDTTNEQDLVDALLRLIGIGTPQAYAAKLGAMAVHHRRSRAHESSEHHVFTWLMLGEHRARQMNVPTFDVHKLEGALRQIRGLTIEKPSVFEPRMRRLCHEAGVALVLEPPIGKTCLFGSARWFDAERAIIQMSLRMKTNDHFWWTFFHGAAHVILHRGRNFVDDQNGVGDGLEEEADRWAEKFLVGKQLFAQFKAERPRSAEEVKSFASEIKLHPGIVVGMLQHARVLPFSHLNALKAKLEWVREKSAA